MTTDSPPLCNRREQELPRLRGPTGRAWTQTLCLIDAAARQDTGMLQHRLTARRLEQILIHGLLLGHQHNHYERLTAEPASPAARATRRAVELLHGRPERPWTTSELAAAVAVSAHSLQTGFAPTPARRRWPTSTPCD